MYLLVCSITSIESLAGFRVLFDYVGARGVFSSINETFSLTRSGFCGSAPIEGPVRGALPGSARPLGVRDQHPAQSVARAGEALPHHPQVGDGPA